MSNKFKTQLIADGVQTDFNFDFAIVKERTVDVYKTLNGNVADETNDKVAKNTYVVVLTQPTLPTSKGLVRFMVAPEKDSIITITPDQETNISYKFSNTQEFNTDNLDGGFSQVGESLSYDLDNIINSTLRYNINEKNSLTNYDNRISPLEDKAFWRREGSKIVSQNYALFVEETAGEIKANITEQVNASANNTNLSADVANKPFGQDYTGNVETIDAQGNVVKTPIPAGKSALSGALSAKQWATEGGEFTDAYGNTGFSAFHYSKQAETAASSAGGIITELYVKSATPVTKVDLIDYSVTPSEPWVNVLENSFTVYVDGIKLPEPKSYSDGSVVPNHPYTVTIPKDIKIPSTITFSPAIAANKEILIARSEAQGNSATMFVDSNNAVFTADSKVAARDFSNINDAAKKVLVDLLHPIGTEWRDLSGTATPPGQGVSGIAWVKQTEFEGHLAVGSSSTGAWAVNPGATRGATQTCDPMVIANLVAHNHTSMEGNTDPRSNLGSGGDVATRSQSRRSTSTTGSASPTGIGLSNLQMYGSVIWRRTA